jgi:hypothetical protein
MLLIIKDQNHTHIVDFNENDPLELLPTVDYMVETFLYLISDLFYKTEDVKRAAMEWKP